MRLLRHLAPQRWCRASASVAAGGGSAMALEFRRFCEEQVAPVATGVPIAAFTTHVARTKQLNTEAAEKVIRDSGCFSFEGNRILLNDASRLDVADFLPAMQEIAGRIPTAGAGANKMKELLAELAPNFSPAAIGAYTLRDALQMFPNVFQVEPAAKGKWLVRPVQKGKSSSEAPQVGGKNSAAAVTLLELISKHSSPTEAASLTKVLRTVPASSPLFGMPRSDVVALLGELEPLLDVSFEVRLRPRHPPRGCFAFIDGDGVSPRDVDQVFAACGYTNSQSTKTVVRRGASVAHGPNDVVVDERVPAYMGLELQALQTLSSATVVLKDVVYICSPQSFQLYRDRVAVSVPFPDAEVFVASVGAIAKIQ